MKGIALIALIGMFVCGPAAQAGELSKEDRQFLAEKAQRERLEWLQQSIDSGELGRNTIKNMTPPTQADKEVLKQWMDAKVFE